MYENESDHYLKTKAPVLPYSLEKEEVLFNVNIFREKSLQSRMIRLKNLYEQICNESFLVKHLGALGTQKSMLTNLNTKHVRIMRNCHSKDRIVQSQYAGTLFTLENQCTLCLTTFYQRLCLFRRGILANIGARGSKYARSCNIRTVGLRGTSPLKPTTRRATTLDLQIPTLSSGNIHIQYLERIDRDEATRHRHHRSRQ